VVLFMAALAPAHAQTPGPGAAPQSNQAAANDQGDLFRMPEAATVFGPLTTDPRAPGRFRRVTGGSAGPTRIGQLQVYGTPPAAGAGATGFDSTNVTKR
jgi:hypothetical protein